MLKAYFGFYWLALKEYLPEKRRKLLRVVYLVAVFIVGWIVADFFGIALKNPLMWVYHLMPGSSWVIVGLLVVVAFQCFVIEGARRVYGRTTWLQDLAERDRQNIGAGVKITGCEVDIDISHELNRGWVEFRFKIFDGSVFPIAVGDMSGVVSFSNGREFRKLDGKLEMLPNLSAENCQRHQVGHFTIRQELSKEDVAFISSANSGCFMFGDLVINVRARGEAFEDLPATPIATTPDDVQPTLRGAFRHDASALKAKRQAELKSGLERVKLLSEVVGRARELVRVHNAPQFIPLEDMKSLAREIETALHNCYGNKALKKFYPFNFQGERLEGPDQYSQGAPQWFVQYLNQLVVTLEREESEAVEEAGEIAF